MKKTLLTLKKFKSEGQKIAALTCYDASFAQAMNEAEMDALLVGDSMGSVIQGHNSTVPVTLEAMAYHVACVARAKPQALLIGDMPFMSYATPEQAMETATCLMQAGADMLKLEGGQWLCETVGLLTERGIACAGHLGLTPQSISTLGAYRVQGKTPEAAKQIFEDAKALEAAGAQLLFLECVPAELAREISAVLSIPTIGIGSGPGCDGQILVLHDMLGLGHQYKMVKVFLDQDNPTIVEALKAYRQAVQEGTFPGKEHTLA